MTVLGTLSINAETGPGLPSADFDLNLVNFTDGFPQVDPVAIGEPVSSRGVDFIRMRLVRTDYKPFSMACETYVEDYAAAVTLARSMRTMEFRNGGLIFTAGGTEFDFSTRQYYILSVRAAPFNISAVVQAGLADGLHGAVQSTWTLQDSGA